MCHFQAVQHTSSTHIDYLLKPPWYSIPETWEVEVSAVSDYSIHHSAGWLESVLSHLEGIPVGCPHLLKGCRATTSQMRSAALEGELFCFGAIMYGKANDCSSKMLFSKHSPWDGGLWNLDFLGGGVGVTASALNKNKQNTEYKPIISWMEFCWGSYL